MQFASFSTTNFQTFADLSFRFVLTPGIAVQTLAFAVVIGPRRRLPARNARSAPGDCRSLRAA
jgi:hypothetical protein